MTKIVMINEKMLGPLIAKGGRREVYCHKTDPDLVIKKHIDFRAKEKRNQKEAAVWELCKDTELRHWLAPIHGITECGTYLLQTKGAKIKNSELPIKQVIPKELRSDIKPANWVRIGSHVVLCDYDHKQLDKIQAKNQ